MNSKILTDVGISSQDCQALNAALNRCEALRQRPRHAEPHVVCTGIYNAGKSTLLNALTGTDHFPTGDIPTTKEVAQLTQNGFVYVDTPGLNSQGADDAVTAKALKEADVILFACAAQNGGLTQAEADWLRELQKDFGERFSQRLIFAMTKCGQLDDAGVEKVAAKFGEDFRSVLGFAPLEIFRTDAAVWADGIAQNESLLVQAGGIGALRKYVLDQCKAVQQSLETDAQADWGAAVNAAEEIISRLQGQCWKCMAQQQGNPAEVEQLFEQAKASISSATDCSVDLGHFCCDFSMRKTSYEGKSESSVRREATQAVESHLRKCASQAHSYMEDAKVKARKYYASEGMNSVYFESLDSVNRALEECLSKLRQAGVPVEKGDAVQVKPDISDLYSEIGSKILDFHCSESDYTYKVDIDVNDCSYIDYRSGRILFHTVRVPKYYANIYRVGDAVGSICEDVKSEIDHAKNWIHKFYLESFFSEVRAEANRRLAAMRKQVYDYLASQDNAARKPYQDACDYLYELEKELK